MVTDQVISIQPGALGRNPSSEQYSSGLDYLRTVDVLLVRQRVELLEAFTSFEARNKYDILNSVGQPLFTAKEESGCMGCCKRNCCGAIRPFGMDVTDNVNKPVFHIDRPLRCNKCCCCCCLQKIEVTTDGALLGTVEQDCFIFYPQFSVKDADGRTVLRIEGSCCKCKCFCSDINFNVFDEKSGDEVGKISKQWSGFIQEAYTDADNFGVSFPKNLDINIKATLLAATFLIDFMFFEENQIAKRSNGNNQN